MLRARSLSFAEAEGALAGVAGAADGEDAGDVDQDAGLALRPRLSSRHGGHLRRLAVGEAKLSLPSPPPHRQRHEPGGEEEGGGGLGDREELDLFVMGEASLVGRAGPEPGLFTPTWLHWT